jgi:HK97 family phage portal protein
LLALFEKRSWLVSPMLLTSLASQHTATGLTINDQAALTYAAFWSAVSRISADVASLPLFLWKRDKTTGGRVKFVDHPLYRLLHDEPNPEMTALIFRETMQAHVLTWGNGYAEIQRNQAGQPVALWPVTPDRVTPERPIEDPTGPIRYRVFNQGGREALVPASDMLHVPGLGWDGTKGYSVVGKARESISLGLATQNFGATFFSNGASFGGIFTHPKTFAPGAKETFEKSIRDATQGVGRAHNFITLQEGVTYTQLGIPPDDAQFLETRKFQITEIARWFNIPPHKLGDLERATFSNIEHLAIEYVTDTLRPWLVRWEQEINRKLIAKQERGIQYVEHQMDALLRGDLKSRFDAYAVGRQWGFLTLNQIAEKENWNPETGEYGDTYLVPANYTTAEKLLQDPPPAEPAPTQPSSRPDDDEDMREILNRLQQVLIRAERAEQATEQARESLNTLHTSLNQAHDDNDAERAALEASEKDLSLQVARLEVMAADARAEADRLTALVEAERVTHRAELAQRVEAEASEKDLSLQVARLEVMAADARAEADRLTALVEAERVTHRAELAQRVEADTAARSEADARIEALRAALDVANEKERQASALYTSALANHASLEADVAHKQAEFTSRLADLDAEKRETAAAMETVRQGLAQMEAQNEQDRAALEAMSAKQLSSSTEASTLSAALQATATELETARESLSRHDADASSVLTAQHALIADVMRRMVERETDRIRRAQASPEKLRHVIETFYDGHEDLMERSLVPSIRVYLAWCGSGEDAGAVARSYARRHVDESLRQLRLVLDGDADAFAVSLPALLARWERDRAATIADDILKKGLDHARGH